MREQRHWLVALPLRGLGFAQRTLQVQARAGRQLPSAVAAFAEHLIAVLDQTEI